MTSVTITDILRSHASWDNFETSLAIDWAIDQLRQGSEQENVSILASLNPLDSYYELRKYLSAALRELELDEYSVDKAQAIQVQYHLECILRNENCLEHLKVINEFCFKWGYRQDLMPFYTLEFAWDELRDFGTELYYGTDKDNFVRDLHKEASNWIRNHSVLD